MPFQTNCTNKGCGEYQEPYLDLNDNNVYCSKCENIINNITIFAKNQMKSNKQFKKQNKKSNCFKCLSCKQDNIVILQKEDVVCSKCLNPMNNLSSIFKETIKQILKNNKDL